MTQLSRTDLNFIDVFIKSNQHREILKNGIEALPPVFNYKVGGRYYQFAKNIFIFIQIIVEFVIFVFTKQPSVDKNSSLFYVYDQEQHDYRYKYLEYHLPHEDITGISYKNKICFSSLSFRFYSKLLFNAVVILTKSLLTPSRVFPSGYFKILRKCLVVHSHARKCNASDIYLFYIYKSEIKFLSAYLKEQGFYVNLIAGDAPLFIYNQYLIGDSLKACIPYQFHEFQVYSKNCSFQDIEQWSPENIRKMDYYKDAIISENNDIIGLYTQGFRLRHKLGLVQLSFAEYMINAEQELINIVVDYVNNNADVQLIIFPHPLERRYFQKDIYDGFSHILNHPRISIDWSGKDSVLSFGEVGLGITLLSGIGFDRVFMGFRTIFWKKTPDIQGVFPDVAVDSPYHKLFVDDPITMNEKMKTIQMMTHQEFMQKYFKRAFGFLKK